MQQKMIWKGIDTITFSKLEDLAKTKDSKIVNKIPDVSSFVKKLVRELFLM